MWHSLSYLIAIRSLTKMVVCNKFYLQCLDYTLQPEEGYQSVIEMLQIKFVANMPFEKTFKQLLITYLSHSVTMRMCIVFECH